MLDGPATDDDALRAVGKLLTVRQVAKLLGVCAATVYRMCGQGELERFRVRNAIRVPVATLKVYLARARR